jgi:multidrug resistance efflux pump
MLPNRNNEVRVRASFDGEVELLVRPGERVYPGQALAVVEGEREVERLASRSPGSVTEVHVRTGQEVRQGALLLVIQEISLDN